MTATDIALSICLFFGAILYSSVGHAGASAYIALMALFGVPTPVMRPTALVLNLIVASLGSLRYSRAGLFRWRTIWPRPNLATVSLVMPADCARQPERQGRRAVHFPVSYAWRE